MRAAIWARVSTEEQDVENQVGQLTLWAGHRGMEVVQVYRIQESAFRGAHQRSLSVVYDQARTGGFDVLLVWALDRLSREGVAATLEIINRLARYRVAVWSHQESWTEVEGPLRELLFSVVAWVARMESQRRSERTKAGMARARAAGVHVGRPTGAKDGRRRRRRRREGGGGR